MISSFCQDRRDKFSCKANGGVDDASNISANLNSAAAGVQIHFCVFRIFMKSGKTRNLDL